MKDRREWELIGFQKVEMTIATTIFSLNCLKFMISLLHETAFVCMLEDLFSPTAAFMGMALLQ
jgi:hypothetical protein